MYDEAKKFFKKNLGKVVYAKNYLSGVEENREVIKVDRYGFETKGDNGKKSLRFNKNLNFRETAHGLMIFQGARLVFGYFTEGSFAIPSNQGRVA